MFLLTHPLILLNTNETCPHPSKEGRASGVRNRCHGPHPSEEGRGSQAEFSVPAHIPQERGGAGNRRCWCLEVVVVIDEHNDQGYML